MGDQWLRCIYSFGIETYITKNFLIKKTWQFREPTKQSRCTKWNQTKRLFALWKFGYKVTKQKNEAKDSARWFPSLRLFVVTLFVFCMTLLFLLVSFVFLVTLFCDSFSFLERLCSLLCVCVVFFGTFSLFLWLFYVTLCVFLAIL